MFNVMIDFIVIVSFVLTILHFGAHLVIKAWYNLWIVRKLRGNRL